MKLSPEELQRALREADALFDRWSRFSTPSTGASIAPSIPNAVLRYVKTRPGYEALERFLQCVPTSSLSTYSASARPQAAEVTASVRKLVQQTRARLSDEEMAHLYLTTVLGWACKQLAEHDRRSQGTARPRGEDRRRT